MSESLIRGFWIRAHLTYLEQLIMSERTDEISFLFTELEPSAWAQPVSAVRRFVPQCYLALLLQTLLWCNAAVGAFRGGRHMGCVTMMPEPLTSLSWPSNTESAGRWSFFSADHPNMATSLLLALACAWPQGQKVEGRPSANTSFPESSHDCIQSAAFPHKTGNKTEKQVTWCTFTHVNSHI